MKYLRMDGGSQLALLANLRSMPAYLAARFGGLTAEEALRPGPANTFSPVEQCWHLADLEREGFGERMRRLRAESKPVLPDFDGETIARVRNYRGKSLAEALAAFQRARAENLAFIESIDLAEWNRDGVQEGVGPVALCDIPVMMSQHDAAHRAEIEAWGRQ
ncbi:MAG: DinB family protein [Steroidobacteraceae bacterium]